MDFLARNSHHAQGHCHGGECTCQARVRVFSYEQILLLLRTETSDGLGSKHSASMKGEKFLDQLSDYWLLKNDLIQ
jgi:hypothetical protein